MYEIKVQIGESDPTIHTFKKEKDSEKFLLEIRKKRDNDDYFTIQKPISKLRRVEKSLFCKIITQDSRILLYKKYIENNEKKPQNTNIIIEIEKYTEKLSIASENKKELRKIYNKIYKELNKLLKKSITLQKPEQLKITICKK